MSMRGVPKSQARQIVIESVLVALVGGLLALAANQISPRGLVLPRNYFPGERSTNVTVVITTNANPGGIANTNTRVLTPAEQLAAQLKANGLQLAESNQVAQLFADPRYQQELVVFIDARDDRHYLEGHIPGAYQLDHYRKENYLATVLPVCATAEQIVLYCNGGNCEDSQFAAITLRDAGIANEKLFVYGGGMAEWSTNGMPVEIGIRKSGNLRTNAPPATAKQGEMAR